MDRIFGESVSLTSLLKILLLVTASFSLGYLFNDYSSSLKPLTTLITKTSNPYQDRTNPGQTVKNQFNRLHGLGYTGGVKSPGHPGGITVHKDNQTFKGYNLYSSNHAPEAYLMDMDGTILHQWNLEFKKAFPNHVDGFGLPNSTLRQSHWRMVHLMENGSLLAVFAENGIIKIDRNSNLVWARYNYAHHDLTTGPEGSIYTITRNLQVPNWKDHKPVLVDSISVLGEDGYQIKEHSIFQALLGTGSRSFRKLFNRRTQPAGDVLHTNSIKVYSKEDPRLPEAIEGDGPFALVSSKKLNLFGFIDLNRNKFVWTATGLTRGQHDPRLLDNGNLLVFDNHAPNGYSRVLEINPKTKNIVWKYTGNESNHFETGCCGISQRLPNGNTLITETNSGRSFEVTPEKDIVWEFYSPHRKGKNVARLFQVTRLSRSDVSNWLTE